MVSNFNTLSSTDRSVAKCMFNISKILLAYAFFSYPWGLWTVGARRVTRLWSWTVIFDILPLFTNLNLTDVDLHITIVFRVPNNPWSHTHVPPRTAVCPESTLIHSHRISRRSENRNLYVRFLQTGMGYRTRVLNSLINLNEEQYGWVWANSEGVGVKMYHFSWNDPKANPSTILCRYC